MKTIILTIATFVFTLVANAQSAATYFAPVSETVEIGFGFNPQNHKFVLSVIEESKDDVDFNIDVTNAFGRDIMSQSFDEGTVTVIPKTKKVNYYECNYELTPQELNFLLFNARFGGNVNINGVEMNGSALINAIHNIMKF
ncbi:MAG: hypothetical protein MJY81_00120 [Bacteroidaceae bacterium]|nr:hypothetical protein [Bacteroidaceae bacterium]